MKVLVNFSPTYLHLVFKSGTLQSRINVGPTFINFEIGQEENPKIKGGTESFPFPFLSSTFPALKLPLYNLSWKFETFPTFSMR